MTDSNTDLVLDFDGTCVDHRFPRIGQDVPLAVPSMKFLSALGVRYILSTMRSGKRLDESVNWFKERNIELYGIQEHPTQREWTSSPKAHGELSIDDRNVGTPLMTVPGFARPCVQWGDLDVGMRTILGVTSLTLIRAGLSDFLVDAKTYLLSNQ